MRCPQCGFDALAQSAFCSRCGARLGQPKPAEVREYALALIRPSYWHYAHLLAVGGLMVRGDLSTLGTFAAVYMAVGRGLHAESRVIAATNNVDQRAGTAPGLLAAAGLVQNGGTNAAQYLLKPVWLRLVQDYNIWTAYGRPTPRWMALPGWPPVNRWPWRPRGSGWGSLPPLMMPVLLTTSARPLTMSALHRRVPTRSDKGPGWRRGRSSANCPAAQLEL